MNEGSFKVVGIKLPRPTTNLNGQSMNDIGLLWQKFKADDIYQDIPGKIDGELLAIYYNYQGGDQDPFDYFIGARVEDNVTAPDHLQELTIPKSDRVKFSAQGPIPQCIGEAWQKIWSAPIERAFEYDFEVYSDKSSDLNNAEIDIYISVV